MKKTFATLMLAALALPGLTSAAGISDIEEQVMFMLGRTAALQAIAQGTSVACGLVTSKSLVRVGEPFELIWNSVGALPPSSEGASRFAERGIQTVTQSKAGRFTYKMSFVGANGGEATCFAIITILP